MALEFGFIQEYNTERGFGYLSRTFQVSRHSTQRVYFHIKKVKGEYPDLAKELDNGLYQNVSFWYETEKINKGEQVCKLWLDAKDLPNQQRNWFTAEIEKLWSDLNFPILSSLNQVTLALVGQDLRDKLNQEREQIVREQREAGMDQEQVKELTVEELLLRRQRRKEAERQKQLKLSQEAARLAEEEKRRREAERQAQIRADQEATRIIIEQQRKARLQFRASNIQQICEIYGIETLVHFTHSRNLMSILQHGLLGRVKLDSLTLVNPPQCNDAYRLDQLPEAVCLSISFPNYKMFFKYSKNNREEWVVLLLNAAVLWELNCAFCRENAASNNVTGIPLEIRKQPAALKQMFANYDQITRQNLNIPINYPTHPQAEVLVFDPIPPRYIYGVHFYNQMLTQQWLNLNPGNFSQEFYGERRYFSFRADYNFWKS